MYGIVFFLGRGVGFFPGRTIVLVLVLSVLVVLLLEPDLFSSHSKSFEDFNLLQHSILLKEDFHRLAHLQPERANSPGI